MATITKEKNLLKIQYSDKNKPYVFDMSTGRMYGLSGTVLKNSPSGMVSVISQHMNDFNVLKYLFRIHSCYGTSYANMSNWVNGILFWDRLDSIGYGNSTLWEVTDNEAIQFVEKHFKKFATVFRENPEISIRQFYNNYSTLEWAKENHIKVDDYFTIEDAEFLKSLRLANAKQNSLAVYYIKKGIRKVLSGGSIHNLITKYCEMCDKLNTEYVKGDFIREYAIIKSTYDTHKEELDRTALINNQMKNQKALTFSLNGLEVVIPTTKQEFIDEGNNQSNCVSRLYLPKVMAGTTNVVFIRKSNELDKSYITCEVNNGRIIQYLARYNNQVTDENALDFKKQFEKHLKDLWER